MLPTQAPQHNPEIDVVPAPTYNVNENYPNKVISDQVPLPQLMHPAREYSDVSATPQRPIRMAPSFAINPVPPSSMNGTPSTPVGFYAQSQYAQNAGQGGIGQSQREKAYCR